MPELPPYLPNIELDPEIFDFEPLIPAEEDIDNRQTLEETVALSFLSHQQGEPLVWRALPLEILALRFPSLFSSRTRFPSRRLPWTARPYLTHTRTVPPPRPPCWSDRSVLRTTWYHQDPESAWQHQESLPPPAPPGGGYEDPDPDPESEGETDSASDSTEREVSGEREELSDNPVPRSYAETFLDQLAAQSREGARRPYPEVSEAPSGAESVHGVDGNYEEEENWDGDTEEVQTARPQRPPS